jgi:hypothetical protein
MTCDKPNLPDCIGRWKAFTHTGKTYPIKSGFKGHDEVYLKTPTG